jgi:pSer/pThr/pTyr-binding forkhead associated (FHA) protein
MMAELLLEIVEGPGAGERRNLVGVIELGRDPAAALVVDDELVSRRHARIAPRDGGAVVEDLGSSNGTFVNGEEIHAPTRIDPGDQVVVGVTVLELRSAAQVAVRPTAVRQGPPALATPARRPDYVPREIQQESELDPLLDTHTKARARTAPLALLILVVFVILVFLATR